ncbi:MAG: glycosyl hydrolase 115 family protein [Lachnospiraceae bacterium]|nr:glycosyl hydrolase 115 family protein [Lachnospiraceae bacterium]
MELKLVEKEKAIPILVEEEGFEGVRRIAAAVAEDIFLVTAKKPEVLNAEEIKKTGAESVIFCATVGNSPLLEKMENEGIFSAEDIRGKREVFKIALTEAPFAGVSKALVICGSDKRGTIYGMFTLSEYLGVTPLVYFGDAAPAKCAEPVVREDIVVVSKEPSVKYRGFFINDEWPCFGNWACSHFGGVNAQMYRHVFEFLLRMKGNYLWPAMWASSFPLDGPGSANEELADIYGVVMGYSHHEPCLRASEEWDKVRGRGTRYGNEWNFYTNEQGLLNYWEDSLKRSGKYENIITIGMRGERDSSMLGENATVEENVNLLKDIIKKQRQLIRENVNEDLSKVPQMLALYKEVEAYFYGDEHVAGLKDWEELDGVICMLCEDNFGHMRTLPTEEMRNRKGGFGMYYHFDYHGGPISYEWVDSTPLSKTWEQMCTAYEYGIRDLWIVNVGDLKLHEVPLTYFMALAYDYDRWGSSNPESYRQFAAQWAKKSFPKASSDLQEKAARVLTKYIDMNHLRRPESLNENIYHSCHYLEADRMLKMAEEIENLNRELTEGLDEAEREGYYSMVGFSAASSANLLKMHLYAGKSRHYAAQGRPVANRYADLAQQCIGKDRRLAEEFAGFKDGKWSGMQLASHIGFTKWNEDGSRYPMLCRMEPMPKARMSVSRKDEERVAVKNYGAPDVIRVHDFLNEGCEEVILEVANDGKGTVHYQIFSESGRIPKWLDASPMEGDVEELQDVVLHCNRELLTKEQEKAVLIVSDGDARVAIEIIAAVIDKAVLPAMTFLPTRGVITMNADHYAGKKDVSAGGFECIENYGRYGAGMKVLPCTVSFEEEQEKPELTYCFLIPETGFYRVELLTAPTNPAVKGQKISIQVAGGDSKEAVTLIPPGYRAGESGDANWSRGVLDQIHIAETVIKFEKGVQELTLGAMEAGTVLERIRIYREEDRLPVSYLGPEESYFVK